MMTGQAQVEIAAIESTHRWRFQTAAGWGPWEPGSEADYEQAVRRMPSNCIGYECDWSEAFEQEKRERENLWPRGRIEFNGICWWAR